MPSCFFLLLLPSLFFCYIFLRFRAYSPYIADRVANDVTCALLVSKVLSSAYIWRRERFHLLLTSHDNILIEWPWLRMHGKWWLSGYLRLFLLDKFNAVALAPEALRCCQVKHLRAFVVARMADVGATAHSIASLFLIRKIWGDGFFWLIPTAVVSIFNHFLLC